MDVFSATLCSAQALAYALSVMKSLTECHLALKHGRGFLCDQQANVGHLQEILNQLKLRTRLDPSLKSLLESINITVHDLLLLVKQRKRHQLLILLVIRRTEVNESFALLERKKSTLNLYLTTQTSFAIASLKTVILPHSTKGLEMADSRTLPDSSYGSNSEADEKEYVNPPIDADQSTPILNTSENLASDMAHQTLYATTRKDIDVRHEGVETHGNARHHSLALGPQSSASTTPRYVTLDNVASGTAHQTLYAAASQEIDVRHEENESSGNARQFIGILESPPSRPQKRGLSDMKNLKKEFYAYRNKAMIGAVQKIFAPEQQTTDMIHKRNISNNTATQLIGKDPYMPRVKRRMLGRFLKHKNGDEIESSST